MFAINHAATALKIKKKYQGVPIVWLLISVQFVEILWVVLNYIGVEQTTVEPVIRYVGDVHLSYMPYSHSVGSVALLAILSWFVLDKSFGRRILGIAVGLGVASHILLDLALHGRDIALAPFIGGPKIGLGL